MAKRLVDGLLEERVRQRKVPEVTPIHHGHCLLPINPNGQPAFEPFQFQIHFCSHARRWSCTAARTCSGVRLQPCSRLNSTISATKLSKSPVARGRSRSF